MKNDVPVRIVRVFKLLEYLSAFPAKSVDKLAQMIGVSIKTIYKDIILLESSGLRNGKRHQSQISYKIWIHI
jgi:predicted DNA-binding transcriptional regulator YafY